MASAWFDSVTGTNDYERQSYRDSYNGGQAAGDWTGNVNKNLDAQRDAFQGATWSGSSTQPSAIQLAQSVPQHVAPAAPQGQWVSTGMRGQKVWVAAPVTAGPGAVGAVNASNVPTRGAGAAGWSNAPSATGVGPSAPVVVSDLGPLTPTLETKNTQLLIGGVAIFPNPGTSDASEIENMMGEGDTPLEPAFWVKQAAAASHISYNMPRLFDYMSDSLGSKGERTQFKPGGGAWITEGVSEWWSKADSRFGPDKPLWGFDSGGF